MNEIQLAKFLGWFSIALGGLQLVAGRRINRALGLGQSEQLVAAFGAHGVVAGAVILTHPDTATPVWSRVAGDALDLAVLGAALSPGNARRPAAAWATFAVLGITVVDVVCASALAARHSQALRTAERTRIK